VAQESESCCAAPDEGLLLPDSPAEMGGLHIVKEAKKEVVPDFAREWTEIREDLETEATGALRIGRNLIKIRDALKPLGLWLTGLREHGMSQSQASRYIRYAELPKAERKIFQRVKGFSLSAAVGERRGKKAADHSPANGPKDAEAVIPADELEERQAEVGRKLKLAFEIVDAGERCLAGEPDPEYADDHERWQRKVDEVAAVMREYVNGPMEAELRSRLLAGA